MSLRDDKLLGALKVQLQIIGAPQVANSIIATLHYQMVYRVQNHALDLAQTSSNEALLISAERNNTPTCIHVPRQLPRSELIKLLPDSWVTNYEKFRENSQPIQSSEPSFKKSSDGAVTIQFTREKEQPPPAVFQTQMMMEPISPNENMMEIEPGYVVPSEPPILRFLYDGNPVYMFRDEKGHCFFDACDCDDCYWDSVLADDDDHDDIYDFREQYQTPQKKQSQSPCKHFEVYHDTGDPEIDTLGQPSEKFDYLVKYSTPPKYPSTTPPLYSCQSRTVDPSSPVAPMPLPCYKAAR